MNCGAAVPLVIAAWQSASCTFSSAGKFKFSDAASNKKAFQGTITVALPLVSSFSVTPKAVVYGGKSTLSGKLASGQSGQQVQVQALGCTRDQVEGCRDRHDDDGWRIQLPGAALEEDGVHAE